MIITAGELAEFVNGELRGDSDRIADDITLILPGQEDALSFCKLDDSDSINLIRRSLSSVIICSATLPRISLTNKTLIFVSNPRLAFAKSANKFFSWRKLESGIHPTAVIGSKAKIAPSASVGAYCVVSDGTEIGEESVLHSRVTIYSNCKIGSRVIINSGTVIGIEGFGYMPDEEGNQIPFPHIGGVMIEDDVEIGANTCIDRGALGNTYIKQGAKIDNLVHVAHNVIIGRNCFIVCHVGVGGSVEIGDNSYIGIAAIVKNQKKIGKNAMVGMGAVVTKDVADEATVIGNPARPMIK